MTPRLVAPLTQPLIVPAPDADEVSQYSVYEVADAGPADIPTVSAAPATATASPFLDLPMIPSVAQCPVNSTWGQVC
ncbi:hypothetical protein GCM10011579_013030 [Streptomyces albiflavescens]|uniref:Uncharacterized protein n=1 Tax=Streptomyces albiflavescens TaxID=1623582 RepID=A0A917XVG0_9ACTN|nr:hypothetical protein GCM10011579_013030 [Streptomyces albiflavescens]